MNFSLFSGRALIAFALFVVFPSPLRPSESNRGYYRYPAIFGDTVVFTSEGDLWSVPAEGGLARRITTHPGEETRAAFSPDGRTIAFSANYEGPTEVYTMPATGGLPARRTFEGGNAGVAGWAQDGKLLYTTTRFSGMPDAQLAAIDSDNRIEPVPLSQASQGVWDPKGGALFFTRLPFQGSHAKRYKGGTAQNLWKFVPGREAVPLTPDYPGTSKDAMWWNGRVYCLSDRDGTMNLWSIDENGKGLRQHTKHQGWDMKSPSLSAGRIVYQLGADLRIFDTRSGADRAIPIELPSDFDSLRERWIQKPMEYATAGHFSPDGSSVVAVSRGRVFVIPAKQGRLVDVTAHRPGRYRDARMMPGGKSLIALSTESGEVEIWKLAANGAGGSEQLTRDGNVLRWEAIPSPDGSWIVHQDKDNRLWLMDAAGKSQKLIERAETGGSSFPAFADVRWSPDSRWIAYTRDAANQFSQILLYAVETGAITPLTTDRYNSGDAAWSPDGKWIYFLSDRSLKSLVGAPWGARQPDPFFDRSMKLYQIALRKGLRSPFEPADELHPEKKEEPKPDAKPGEAVKVKVDIDLDGIAGRMEEVPAPAGNYASLAATGKRLCWTSRDLSGPAKSALECMDIANKGDKPEAVLDNVSGFEFSADGKKMLVRRQNELYIFDSGIKDAKAPKALADAQVNLAGWAFSVIPSEEFREALLDAWRLHRDYFYDPHMHGVNWAAMRDKYGELIGRVRDRQELSDLIAQMVSELSVLHTTVVGGDVRRGPDQVRPASLGALLVRDKQAGGYRIEHIYRSDPDRPDKRSPLARAGVEAGEGDVVVAVNGRELAAADPGELLRNQAGKQVLVRLRPKSGAGTRDVIVKPISMEEEADLRYHEWEFTRREIVERESGGKLGYVHLRAMGPDDINQWVENFYPVVNRDGLIVDVRHNRGGNIDSWILSKLMRRAWMYWKPRTGAPYWNMQAAFRGPVVVLCDQRTASDGEAFAEGFRRLGLGKVIGMRTWGGEIWLTGSNTLADRGVATAAEMGVYGPERKWLVEGHGVDPDIVVDNLPYATFQGKDAQLAAAISYLQQAIHEKPNPVPEPPPYPDKSR